jgi:hypothetical protein
MQNSTGSNFHRKRVLLALLFAGLLWCSLLLPLLPLCPPWHGGEWFWIPLLLFWMAITVGALPWGIFVSAREIYRMRRQRQTVPIKRNDFALALITLIAALSALFMLFGGQAILGSILTRLFG